MEEKKKRRAPETGDGDTKSLRHHEVAAKAPVGNLAAPLTPHGEIEREAASPLSGYLEAVNLVERLHGRLLNVISDELERAGRSDVDAAQALLLYNIGDRELTPGELRTRGYHLGSSTSHNIKTLVETGYLQHQRSRTDPRSVRISLSGRGQDVATIVGKLHERHVRSIDQIGGIGAEDFQLLNRSLQRLERFWTDQILYRL